MFQQTLAQNRSSRRVSLSLGFAFNGLLVIAGLLVPLVANGTLPASKLAARLFAPTAPTAPAKPGQSAPRNAPPIKRWTPDDGKLYQPPSIPKNPPAPDELEPPRAFDGPNLIGSIPCGQPGLPPCAGPGIPGGPGAVPFAFVPPPAPPKVEVPAQRQVQRIRVGGNVQKANLIHQPQPVYPDLARRVRIQGTVRMTAVISKEGAIEHLTVVSGHPLLAPAAIEAVRQWRYKPTLLNGEPVEVITQIDVNFTLQH